MAGTLHTDCLYGEGVAEAQLGVVQPRVVAVQQAVTQQDQVAGPFIELNNCDILIFGD